MSKTHILLPSSYLPESNKKLNRVYSKFVLEIPPVKDFCTFLYLKN